MQLRLERQAEQCRLFLMQRMRGRLQSFLKGEIKYTDIVRSIEKCMDAHKVSAHPDLEEILATEQWVYSVLQ